MVNTWLTLWRETLFMVYRASFKGLCLALMAMSTPAYAQETISIGYQVPKETQRLPLNLRRPTQSEQPRVLAGLQVEKFAKSSPDIRGLALGVNGELLVLDGRRAQISVMIDRDKDGGLDMTRRLPARFNNPVSMITHDDLIYVADEDAVWEISENGQRKLASLSNVSARRDHRPILMAPDDMHIYLGLSETDGTAKIVAINRDSGVARPVAEGKGQITALAQTKGTTLWVGMENALLPVNAGQLDESLAVKLPDHVSLRDVYLPTAESMTAKGLTPLTGKFLLTLRQDHYGVKSDYMGRQIVALNSSFGQPDGKPTTIIGGFLANHGRTAWGEPGPMVWDERGLFMADTQSGTIWRVSRLEPKIRMIDRPVEKKEIKFYKSEEVKKPKASWGSSIENGSSIVSGSQLSVDWEQSKLIPKETLMEKLRKKEAGEHKEKAPAD